MTTSSLAATDASRRVADLEARLRPRAELPAEQRIDLLAELAWELRSVDTDRCALLAAEACREAEEHAYAGGLGYALLARGYAGIRGGSFEQAEEDASRARGLFEELDDKRGIYRAHNLLGMVRGEQGNLTSALEHFLASRRLCEELHDQRGEADALNNAALAYTYLSNYPNALELYLKAFDLYQELDFHEGVARALLNIGLAHLEMGGPEEATRYLQRALELPEIRADTQMHALTLLNIGRSLAQLGRAEEALAMARESLRVFVSSGDGIKEAHALDTLGMIYRDRGEAEVAFGYFARALAIKIASGDRLGLAKTRLELGLMRVVEGRDEEALALFEQAFDSAEAVGSKADVYRIHLALSELHERRADLPRALHHLRCFIRVRDEVFNQTSEHRLASLKVSFQVEQAEMEREIYRLKNIELADADRQREALLAQLGRQAMEDAVTGLYNRRHFDNAMARAFEDVRGTSEALSVLICDIDNFKGVNDAFGHQVGDRVLSTIAGIFREQMREADTIARYGGEEFVVLMPGVGQVDARRCAEHLRAAVEDHPWHELALSLHITVSIGLSSDTSVLNHEKMIAAADHRLYEAKRSGRNRVRA